MSILIVFILPVVLAVLSALCYLIYWYGPRIMGLTDSRRNDWDQGALLFFILAVIALAVAIGFAL